MSLFSSLDILPPDPILGLTEAYRADRREKKVHLGVGAYRDSAGSPYVFSCVSEAEKKMGKEIQPKEYAPILGDIAFRRAWLAFLLPHSLLERNQPFLFTAQTVGGTGALCLTAKLLFLRHTSSVYLPMPTWPNHLHLFSRAGLAIQHYPYFDRETGRLSFSALSETLSTLPYEAAVLFQGECHNPTGADLTEDQWEAICSIVKERGLIPLFDIAYHGFGNSLAKSLSFLHRFIEENIACFVCYSFAKNMGLYGERLGAFLFYSPVPEEATVVSTHAASIIRSLYSSPPIHGAHIAHQVLSDSRLFTLWEEELSTIRQRIATMRKALAEELSLPFLADQKGMFSLLPLTPEDVERVKREKGIYLTGDGRINVAGLSAKEIPYVAEAVLSLLKR